MKAAATLAAMMAAAVLTLWARYAATAATPISAPVPAWQPARQPAGSQATRASASASAYPAAPAITPDLSLTDKQQLIPDFALHKLMDGFLSSRNEAGLEAHLRRALPADAANEAIQIAARYRAYLTAHAELLAAQHFTSADAASQDLNRLISWQQQRQQLRIRMLGEQITLEWFGSEEAYLEQALEEWRQRSEGRAPATAGVAPDDQAAHEQHMREALNLAIAAYQRAANAN